MTQPNVTCTYWSHKRKWRVRCFLPAESLSDLGRLLAEEWKASEVSARKSAREMAKVYNAKLEA